MRKTIKYILTLLLISIGIYNLIQFPGQSSALPLYYAVEAFALAGVLALHKEAVPCRKS